MTSITIPEGVTSIGDYAFYACNGLTSIIIPESVTSIGKYAFAACTGLMNITIPSCVTKIGDQAFFGCSGLTSVTIPEGVTSIGAETFSRCSSLTSVTIPSSVTKIGDYAFIYCSGLDSIMVYAKKPPTLGSDNFSNKSEIVLTVPVGCSEAYREAWGEFKEIRENKTTINSIIYGLNLSDATAQVYKYDNENITSVDIQDKIEYNGKWYSVTSIADSAFQSCSSLTSVTIPSSVTEIGDYAFYGCTGLTSVSIPSSVVEIGNSSFYGCTGMTSVIIPSSVTSIDSYAFRECSGLTSIIIPESVASIGSYAFSECTGLTSVTLSEGVTSIGNGAFQFCTGLTSITIPSSVTEIGRFAFRSCSEIENVKTLATVPPTLGSLAFSNKLEIVLTVPVGCSSAYRSAWGEFKEIIEDDVDAVNDIVSDLGIQIQGNIIYIPNKATDTQVKLYTTGGELLYSGAEGTISGLRQGLYILVVDGSSIKVAVK